MHHAVHPQGLVLFEDFCSADAAHAIYATLESSDALSRSWTGLKHGGKSVKCYTGTPAGMALFDNKYVHTFARSHDMHAR